MGRVHPGLQKRQGLRMCLGSCAHMAMCSQGRAHHGACARGSAALVHAPGALCIVVRMHPMHHVPWFALLGQHVCAFMHIRPGSHAQGRMCTLVRARLGACMPKPVRMPMV